MTTPEFSRIFSLEKVKGTQSTVSIHATASECAALAERFSLIAIKSLKAEYTLTKGTAPSSFDVVGVIVGEVVQACVVTLAEVPATLNLPVRIVLVNEEQDDLNDEIDWLYEEVDRDCYQNNEIDLGEITAQYFSLGLDPYPRATAIDDTIYNEDQLKAPNPFSILQNLKK